jgi:alkaline phosphatase D
MMSLMWRDDLPPEVVPALLSLKLIHADAGGPDPDQWEGYPAERARLLDAFERRAGSVVVLSGDIHAGVAAELTRSIGDADEPPVAVEFVTTSLTSQNLDDKRGWAPRTESLAIESRLLETWPHVRWLDLDSHGYVVVDVTPERVAAEWWFVDTLREPSSGERLGARWMMERGRPRLVEVGEPSRTAPMRST